MNPSGETAALPPPTLQPPQRSQAQRPSTSCAQHQEEHFTSLFPSCLCERLAVLEPSTTSSSSSTSRKPLTSSTAAAALKAIFKPPIDCDDDRNPNEKEAPPTDIEVDTRNLGGSSSNFQGPVFEAKEEEEDKAEEDENQFSGGVDFRIEICEDAIVPNVTEDRVPEILEEKEDFQPPAAQYDEEGNKLFYPRPHTVSLLELGAVGDGTQGGEGGPCRQKN
ncbi:hypothetical protein ACFX11_044744 [Malus domestica]